MTGAQPRRPARAGPARALHGLADVINDALGSGGTHPVLAGAPALWNSTIESPSRPDRTARHTPPPARTGAQSDPAAGPDAGTSGAGPDHADDHPSHTDDVDDEHVEIWQLVRRAQDGDGEAFGVLYDRYVDLVFRFIYYRVNDRALAEDFTSETFLRALRRIGSITYQGRDIGAWFVTIARNIVLDHVKSARNRLETTTAVTIETKDHHERSTEAAVLDTLQSERLMEAVNSLGDEQRECIMLRFIQGLSVSETAAVMGKNDGAIKALQHRAVRKLGDIVGTELR